MKGMCPSHDIAEDTTERSKNVISITGKGWYRFIIVFSHIPLSKASDKATLNISEAEHILLPRMKLQVTITECGFKRTEEWKQ